MAGSAPEERRVLTALFTGQELAYIGGCVGTACTISDEMFGVPARNHGAQLDQL